MTIGKSLLFGCAQDIITIHFHLRFNCLRDIGRRVALFLLLRNFRAIIKNRIRSFLGVSVIMSDIVELKSIISQSVAFSAKSNFANIENLQDASFSIYSQFGEDGILYFLCNRLDMRRPRILELGVGNFEECNSRFLAEHLQADVVVVDARTDLIKSVKALPLFWKNHLLPIEEWITPESIRALQETAKEFMGGIDILSIDIDGNDYWVAKEIDFREIEIVVVEYNPFFGCRRAISVPRDDTFDRRTAHFTWDYYGASLLAYVHLLEGHNFTFVGTNRQGTNAFFVKNIKVPLLGLSPVNSYEGFVNCPTRDARDLNARLSYKSFQQRIEDIRGLPVVDVVANTVISLGELTH